MVRDDGAAGLLTPWPCVAEGGLRPGTENTAAIVGMGRAAQLATTELAAHQRQLRAARDALVKDISAACPSVRVVCPRQSLRMDPGADADDADSRRQAAAYSCSVVTLLVPEVPAQAYMNSLQDGEAGAPAVYVGIGSACHVREGKLSPALKSLGLTDDEARRALRIGALSRLLVV